MSNTVLTVGLDADVISCGRAPVEGQAIIYGTFVGDGAYLRLGHFPQSPRESIWGYVTRVLDPGCPGYRPGKIEFSRVRV